MSDTDAPTLRIVVTGGSGRIGSAVVRHLAGLGHDILNLDRQRPRGELPGRFLYTELARRDVLEPRLVDFAPDAACHLAEIPDARRAAEERVYAENAAASGTFFQTLAEVGVRRVAYASSCQVYAQFGQTRPDDGPPRAPAALPMTEAEPPRPNNGYGAQKAGAEAYLSALAHRYGMTAAALRIPGCNDYLNSDWLPYALDPDRRGGRYGERRMHELAAWLDVSDCAAAFAACVAWPNDAPPWQGFEAFNVAAAHVWHRPTDAPPIEQVPEQFPHFPPVPNSGDPFAALFSSEKLTRLTGWQPRVAMRDLWERAGVAG